MTSLPPSRTVPRTSWSAGPVWPISQILLGLLALSLAVTSHAVGALFLYGLAALILLGGGLSHLLRRPRLEIADDDLVLTGFRGRRTVPRDRVVEVRVLPISRIGRRTHVLRLEYHDDAGVEHLDVLTRTDLGTDPRDVLDTLIRRGFPSRSADL